jgi:hypothetical protein
MSLANQVHRHPWISCAVALATCACGTGHGAQKVAGYGPSMAPGYDAPRAAVEPRGEAPDRPGLGTSWGEAVSAPISFAPFVRASAAPWAEVALHYNDAAGATAHAHYLGTRPEPLEIYAGDGALSVALVDEAGRTLPGFTAGGRTLILGEDGRRYRIVVHNATAARFEVVASVDGLDVIDGRPADPDRRGYLVDPYGVLVIDGFRMSDDAVAAFRFGSVADSYAAQTSGDRNVGVIGMAIFAERGARWTPSELRRRDSADPFPQRGYAMPPR